jgi:hypothetical protein
MSERLPYEEKLAQQWKDLPLPDENMAWADMKRRLDDDDDDGLIPIWLRGCALWGIGILLLIAIGWWIFQPQKWFEKKQSASQKEQPGVQINQKDSLHTRQTIPADKSINKSDSLNSNEPNSNQTLKTEVVPGTNRSGRIFVVNSGKTKPAKSKTTSTKIYESDNVQNEEAVKVNPNAEHKVETIPAKQSSKQPDSLQIVQKSGAIISSDKPDTTLKSKSDSSQQKQIREKPKPNDSKKDSSQKNKFSYAAGLGLFQQLPLGGQKLTPYNAEGRKGSIADYIPSVYFRMIRDKKWFVQAEFRYGAPHYNKEFLYDKQVDTFSSIITSTSLKKTFYHQLPVTFNYFITPRWSVGAGVTWNKFVSAVSTQDVIHHNFQTGTDSVIVQGKIISTKDDSLRYVYNSNFVKSYFQGVFETQYQWNRFSVGIKYSFGLQPYIKFRLPGGTEQEEKNQSINIFLRYDLWRSKK